MAQLVRVEPITDRIEELMRGFFQPVRATPDWSGEIRIDVHENDKAYVVQAELPGIKKEDSHVTVERNNVSISGEMKRQNEVKDGTKVVRSERFTGSVYRAFSLPADVDEAQANAKYEDGVLHLTLPKRSGSSNRRVEVR